MTTTAAGAWIGSERRVEGREKVSGEAKFSADMHRAGMLWAAFVISPYPHARIVRIDTAVAKAMSGVHAVLTAADIGNIRFGVVLADWPVLAVERVRLVGDYVAAVAAETREQADAAAAAVEVVYEELPPILDTEAAIRSGAPLVHENDAEYTFAAGTRSPRPHPNLQGYDVVTVGDSDAGFAAAEHVFEHTYRTPRYHPGYIEPRAGMVWIDESGTVHVCSPSKAPYVHRDMLARTLGLPKDKVIVEPSFIGGDFGPKGTMVDDLPLYFLARATGRAVKYVRTYSEDLRSGTVRHASTMHVRLGVTRDGKITALDLRVLYDGGAYAAVKAPPWLLPGRVPKLAYAIPNARIERMSVYTNTIPAGPVRAPGDIQIFFAIESAMDAIAERLGIDPFELRLRNAARPGDTDLEGTPLARPRPREVLQTLREALGWDKPKKAGRGRGIALTGRAFAGGKSGLIATVHPDGRIEVETGAVEPGTGSLTLIRSIIAGELGIDPARISVARGNTNDAPHDPGSGGSKGAVILGHAALDVAHKLRVVLAEHPTQPVRVTGETPQLTKPGDPVWINYCAYGVELSVDVETGAVHIHDVTLVADVGTILNPIGHRGQLEGAFSMGIGHALTEELYLEEGRIINPTLAAYKLPSQRDMPPLRIIELAPDGGPGALGAKAGGEFNVSGVAPAIGNAIADACGVRLDTMSFTAERVYEALRRPHAGENATDAAVMAP
jgi:carbon-monoxide dehydrogenase large subunit